MDCYLFIKLINYIRKHNSSPAEILKLVSENKGDTTKLPWSLDQYMKPHLTDDPWLMYGKRFSMILEKEEEKKNGNNDTTRRSKDTWQYLGFKY